MEKTKHTPGPWHTGGKLDSIVYASDGYAVAGCQTYHGLRDEVSTAANARLIAAAPELLEALQSLLNCIQPDRDWDEAKRARAAIRKAEGG